MTEEEPGNGEDDEDEESAFEKIRRITEENRDANLAEADYEDCERVRQAGQLFRASEFDTPLETLDIVQDALDIDEPVAARCLAIYTLIHTELPGNVSGHADRSGRKYFTGDSIEEIKEDRERTEDEIREDIREFVGGYIREFDLEKVALDEEVPDNPFRVYSQLFEDIDFSAIVPSIDPSVFRLPEVMVPNVDFSPILESIDLTSMVRAADIATQDFSQSVNDALSVFEEADLYFDQEFRDVLSEEARSPPDNWEAYSVIDEIDQEEAEEPEKRDTYEEEGAKAVSRIGNIDRDAARELYLTYFHAAKGAAQSISLRISDGKLAVIAAVSAMLLLYTGNWMISIVFMWHTLSALSNLSGDGTD